MPIAKNPETGDTLFLDGGEWKPAQTARNPETGERIVHDGQGWVPLKSDAVPAAPMPGPGEDPGDAELAYRGMLLPLGKTKEGDISLAWPRVLTGLGEMAENAVSYPGQKMREAREQGSTGIGASPGDIAWAVDTAALATPLSPASRISSVGRSSIPVRPPTEGQRVAMASEESGIYVPRSAATDTSFGKMLGPRVADSPMGFPLRSGAQKTLGDVEKAKATVRSAYGKASEQEAGASVKSGTVGFIEAGKSKVGELYDRVDDLVDPSILTPLETTARVAEGIAGRNLAAGLPEGTAVNFIREPLTAARTYQAVKDLRTRVREMLKTPSALPAGMSQSELKQIYNALSDDLERAVMSSGSEPARSAWRRANTYRAASQRRWENLNRLLKTQNDEASFRALENAAKGRGKGDIQLLRQARKALAPDDWNDVAGGIIEGLGKNNKGEFSLAIFARDFERIDPAAKNLLFNTTGKGEHLRTLENIAIIARRNVELDRFANRSQSGAVALQGLASAGVIGEILTYGIPVQMISILGGNYALARILAKPATASAYRKYLQAAEIAAKSGGNRSMIEKEATALAARISAATGFDRSLIAKSLMGQATPSEESGLQ